MPRKKSAKIKNKNELPATPKKKPVKPKAERKSRVEKPFNAGTMTSAAFFGMLKSALRGKSRYWKPSAKVKLAARRDYIGPNPRQRFEYQCNHCKSYFPDKEVQVDHIIPVGGLNCYEDLPEVVKRLFCTEDGLQVLCSGCHAVKSKDDLEAIKETRRAKNSP